MIFMDGKFYDHVGKIVPLEHGNVEQIALIKKETDRIEALESDDGYDVKADCVEKFDFSFQFKCICGKPVYRSKEGDDDLAYDVLAGNVTCGHCRRKYEVEIAEYTKSIGDLLIRLVK